MSTSAADNHSSPLVVDMTTTTRDDMVDIATVLARALDPDLLNVAGKPIVFTVNGAPNAGKKIFSDVPFEEIGGALEMLFHGRKGHDEFYLDAEGTGPQMSFIDMGWGIGYETPLLNKAGWVSSETLKDTFLKVCSRQGGLAVLQNTKQKIPGVDIFLENGITDPNSNPGHVTVLEHRTDGAPAFAAARASMHDRKWLRQVRIEITDETLAKSPYMLQALADLREGTETVKKLLVEKGVAADALPPRPYQPRGDKPRP